MVLRWLRWSTMALAGLASSACALEPFDACEHGASSDGECCPDWAYAEGGRCIARRWSVATDGLGVNAGRPSVDVDLENRVWLSYEESFHDASAVILAREGGDRAWSLEPLTLGLPGYHYDSKVAAVDAARSVVMWQRGADGSFDRNEVRVGTPDGRFVAPPGGGTFSYPPYALQHKVLAHPDGEVVVAWNQAMDAGLKRGVCVAVRRDGEMEFERPSSAQDVLSRSIIFSNNPELARNQRGDMVVTWYESLGVKLRVVASSRFGALGRFSHPTDDDALSPPEGDVENPEPAVAEDGRAAIVWRQVLPDGRMAVFLSERSPTGVWSKPTIEEGFSGPVDLAWNTRIAFAPSGDLYVAWEQKVGDDWSIMLAHRDATGRWLASGKEPLRLSEHRALEPRLAVAADGTVVVLWRGQMGSRWRVFARRSSTLADGLREVDRWSSATVLSSREVDATSPALTVARTPSGQTGGHRFVAAWEEGGQVFTASLD